MKAGFFQSPFGALTPDVDELTDYQQGVIMYPKTIFFRKSLLSPIPFFLIMLFLLSGCVNRNIEGSLQGMKYDIVGEHYLMKKQYEVGYSYFSDALKVSPDNPKANFFAGRFLLARNNPGKAIPYLKKAVQLAPMDGDNHFWLGVAYGESKNPKKERQSYQKALAVDHDHLQALIYLGNNQLKRKHYKEAQDLYQKALEIWPESPGALYNRALASKYLKRTPEEKAGWIEYLNHHPSGALARRAVEHLNVLGDFSYRIQQFGVRSVPVKSITFQPLRPEINASSKFSLQQVGKIAASRENSILQVVVYQKNNIKLAKNRAIAIKRYLERKFPDLREGRIKTSWFASSEKVSVKGRKHFLGASVRFFTSLP